MQFPHNICGGVWLVAWLQGRSEAASSGSGVMEAGFHSRQTSSNHVFYFSEEQDGAAAAESTAKCQMIK